MVSGDLLNIADCAGTRTSKVTQVVTADDDILTIAMDRHLKEQCLVSSNLEATFGASTSSGWLYVHVLSDE